MAAHGSDLSFSIVALDNASKTFIKLGEQVGKLQDKLEKLDRERVEATVDVDTDRAGRKIDTFSSDLRTKVSAAVRSLPKINIDADSTVADAKLAQIRNELVELGDKTIGVDIDANDARAELSSLQEQLNRLSHDSPDVAVRVNTAEASSQLAKFEAQMAKLDRKDVDVKVKADTSQATKALDSFSNRFALLAAGIVAASPIAGGAILSGIGGAFVAVAAMGQSANNDLRRDVTQMGVAFSTTLERVTEQNLPALRTAVQRLTSETVRMGPQLRQAFSYANPAIHNLTTGVIGAERGLMAGLVPAMRVSGTATKGLSDLMTTMGRTVGNSLIILSQHAGAFSNVMASTGRIVQPVVEGLMRAISGMAEGWSRNSAQIELGFQQLTSTVSAFASGAMAGLGGAFRSAMSLANGLMYALSPIAGVLGNISGYLGPVILGFRAFSSIQSVLSGVSDKLLNMAASTEGVASKFGNLSTRTANMLENMGEGLSQTGASFAGFGAKIVNAGAKGLFSLSKLANFMSGGGVLGLAITGVSLLLSFLGKKQEEAAQDARDHKQMIDTLAQALEDSNGAIDANVRKTQAQSLQNDKNAQALMANGYSLKQITSLTLSGTGAINNQIGALQRQNASLQQTVNEHSTFNQVGVKTVKHMDEIAQRSQGQIDKNNKSIGAWRKLNDVYGKASKKQKQLSDAIKATGDSSLITSNNSAELSGALSKLWDATSTADDKVKALQNDLLLIAEGGIEMARNAFATGAKAVDELGSSLKDAKGRLLDANGQFDLMSDKGRTAYEAVQKVRDSMADYAQQMKDAGRSSGATLQGLQKLRNELIDKLAPAFGGNRQKVREMLDQMGLIPSNIVTKVGLEGASPMLQELGQISDRLAMTPGHKDIKVTSLTKEAEQKLKDLGFKVVHLKNGQFEIIAKDQKAVNKLNDFIRKNTGKVIWTKIYADVSKAEQQLMDFLSDGNGRITHPTIAAMDFPSRQTLAKLIQDTNKAGGRVTIDGNTVPANASRSQILNLINRSHGAVKIDATAKGANTTLRQFLNGVNRSIGHSTIDALDKPGRTKLTNFVLRILRSGGKVKIDGNNVPGDISRKNLVARINSSHGAIKVDTKGVPEANSYIDWAARNRHTTIEMGVRPSGRAAGAGRFGNAQGGILHHYAAGAVVHRYAAGGMEAARQSGLRPMSPIAQVVAPNTWRVVGDRMTDDEAYIPLDGSNRSKAILLTAAQKLFGMASGGLLSDGVGGAAATGASSTVSAPVASVSAPVAPVLSPAEAPPVAGATTPTPAAAGASGTVSGGTGGAGADVGATGGDTNSADAAKGKVDPAKLKQTSDATALLDATLKKLIATITGPFKDAMLLMEQHAGVKVPQAINLLITRIPVLGNTMMQLATTTGVQWNLIRQRILATDNAVWARQVALQGQLSASWAAIHAMFSAQANAINARQLSLQAQLSMSWANIRARITAEDNAIWLRQSLLQAQMRNSWNAINANVHGSVNGQIAAFNGLKAGMAGVRNAATQTQQWVSSQFARMREGAAGPARWIINQPIDNGLIAAWNSINSQFALGHHVNRVPVKFATGGEVSGPGTGTSDSIPAMLSDGEFVVRRDITDKAAPFLHALNSGQTEALQAAGVRGYAKGGIAADTGSQVNAAVAKGLAFAKQQAGKPYIWGGVGPAGFDCSGLMSAITNVITGRNPYHRLFSTASFAGGPTAGFVNGLKSAFAIGVRQGSPGHMAGTLGGTNVESAKTPIVFPGLHGADDGQFGQHFSLPVVGGRFVSGGSGGFDPTAIVQQALKHTYDLLDEGAKKFKGNIAGTLGVGGTRKYADWTKDKLVSKLNSFVGSGGGSQAAKHLARAMLAQFGWGPDQFGPLDQLWQRESGWDPTKVNPRSGAYGIPQANPSGGQGHPYALGDVRGQVMWGLNYIKSRYGSPSAAWAHSQATGWYSKGGLVARANNVHTFDDGGMLAPKSVGVNLGTKPEAVLTPDETTALKTLAVNLAHQQTGTLQPYIGNLTVQAPPNATVQDVTDSIMFSVRHASKGVHG